MSLNDEADQISRLAEEARDRAVQRFQGVASIGEQCLGQTNIDADLDRALAEASNAGEADAVIEAAKLAQEKLKDLHTALRELTDVANAEARNRAAVKIPYLDE